MFLLQFIQNVTRFSHLCLFADLADGRRLHAEYRSFRRRQSQRTVNELLCVRIRAQWRSEQLHWLMSVGYGTRAFFEWFESLDSSPVFSTILKTPARIIESRS